MSVLVYAYPDCEEIELIAVVDILRRAGATVTIYGETKSVKCCNGVVINVDVTAEPKDIKDCLYIPGGNGWPELEKMDLPKKLCMRYKENKKLIATICGASAVLARWGVFAGLKLCGYPGCVSDNATFVEERVVVGDWHVTARGPGVAMELGVAIADKMGLSGQAVKQGTLMQ